MINPGTSLKWLFYHISTLITQLHPLRFQVLVFFSLFQNYSIHIQLFKIHIISVTQTLWGSPTSPCTWSSCSAGLWTCLLSNPGVAAKGMSLTWPFLVYRVKADLGCSNLWINERIDLLGDSVILDYWKCWERVMLRLRPTTDGVAAAMQSAHTPGCILQPCWGCGVPGLCWDRGVIALMGKLLKPPQSSSYLQGNTAGKLPACGSLDLCEQCLQEETRQGHEC